MIGPLRVPTPGELQPSTRPADVSSVLHGTILGDRSDRPDRWRAGSVIAGLIVCLLAPGEGLARSEPAVRFIAPEPAGRGDGSSWAHAASLSRLPELVGQLDEGGEIRLRADRGPYHLDDPIVLGDRGSAAPLTIRGVDPSRRDARPILVGERTAPYSPETAATGRPAFALDTGADGLRFAGLRFRNVGNGCFLLRGAVHDLAISDVTATNVRRFIESEEGDGASVIGLVVQQTTVLGFSKGAVRLRNDSHDVLIEDVVADSRRQDGDVFAMGFLLTDTVHHVVFRRAVAMNARDTVTEYRNGDGFVAERGTYDLLFDGTKAIDNMDAGYDIKASGVTFVGASASGNKRNFRLWGSDVRMSEVRGHDPIRRGGDGTPAQLWAGPSASFTISDARFLGSDSGTIVFDLERSAVGVAVRTAVRRRRGSDLVRLAEDARMTLNGAALRG